MMQIIGKIPTMAEFVTTRAFGVYEPIETWAEQGIAYSHMKHTVLFDDHFDHALPQCFVWEAAGHVIAGLAFPSRDSVGRRFPFIICDEIGSISGYRMALAPIALGDFLEDAFMAATDIFETADRRTIAERAERVRLPRGEHFHTAEKEYLNWLETTPLGEAWRSFVDAQSPELIGPQRLAGTIETARKNGMVRIELGTAGAAGGIALWTEIVTRAAGAPRAVFWSVDGRSMLLTLEAPRAQSFAAAFLPITDVNPVDAEPASVGSCDERAPISQMLHDLARREESPS
jgi:type VI secretion system ImpM family protein